MDVINNNPYRVTGILSNASTKDTHRQKAKIKAYTKVGKELTFPVDFPFLEKINRTADNTNAAFSKIEQNKDKVNYSLFWFIDASPFDKAAIGHLERGNFDKAVDIWSKVALNKEVTSSNFSALNNIGTIKLASSSLKEVKKGIDAKFKLLNSMYINYFTVLVADETFIVDKKSLQKQFVNQILKETQKTISTTEIINLFSNCDNDTKKFLTQKFTESPIHNVEIAIETCKRNRKNNDRNAFSVGQELYTKTKSDIRILQNLLGGGDLQYKLLVDNVAKELLRCGIDYFEYWKKSSDPSEKVLKLFNNAKRIAVGKQTKDRVQENIQGVTEWKSTRLIQGDIEYLVQSLSSFGNKSASVDNAKSLINNCKPKLNNIKNVLGSKDSFYLQISSAVVSNGLGMIVGVINDAQEQLKYNRGMLLLLPGIVSSSLNVINSMSSIDMDYETRRRYQENRTGIMSLDSQLAQVRTQLNRATSAPARSSSSGGCYIATMAYGDYDHPQVIELRVFRDTVLRKSKLGNLFIRYYYKYSPRLVERLENYKRINSAIRNLLNLFIKIIK